MVLVDNPFRDPYHPPILLQWLLLVVLFFRTIFASILFDHALVYDLKFQRGTWDHQVSIIFQDNPSYVMAKKYLSDLTQFPIVFVLLLRKNPMEFHLPLQWVPQ